MKSETRHPRPWRCRQKPQSDNAYIVDNNGCHFAFFPIDVATDIVNAVNSYNNEETENETE